MSSGARSVWEMRSPHDVMNLSTLFGLKQQQGKVSYSESFEIAQVAAQAWALLLTLH